MTQQAVGDKKVRPIVPYIRIPDNYPAEEPYLWGMKCQRCGTAYLGERMACSKCAAIGQLQEVRFGKTGELYTFTVIHQSAPGLPVPYVGAIVDLPDGVSVRANVEGLDPNNPSPSWLGMKLDMFFEKIRTDREGNDIIAYKFRPAKR